MDLSKKRVLVTGAAGFLGFHLVDRLTRFTRVEVLTPTHAQLDLLNQGEVEDYFSAHLPEVVIHLAATVGGIGANRAHPGRFAYENLMMGANVFEASRKWQVEKLVNVGTICAYPKFTPVPFKEADLWTGYPEETNAPYGLAKKMMLVLAQGYRQEYGLNAVFVLPVNLYGPRDNFDPSSSHVIPALIKKFVDAKADSAEAVTVWGSGRPTREFLYVDDCAEALVLVAEKYDKPEPVNIGTGVEISIADVVGKIKDLVGYAGEIQWDPTKPDGQPRRCLDVSRAKAEFGFQARTPLDEGLARTIEWYLENRDQAGP